MPRTTQTYDLREEYDRIDQELDVLADEVAQIDEGNLLYESKIEEASNLERQLAGLEWAIATPDEDEDDHPDRPYHDVRLGALSAGEYAEVRDTLDGDTDRTKGQAGSAGILFAAQGLLDAPFIDDDAKLTQKIATVSEFPPHFQEWMTARVDDLSTPDIEGNAFARRVAESTASATQQK